jgi:hypothetical protein
MENISYYNFTPHTINVKNDVNGTWVSFVSIGNLRVTQFEQKQLEESIGSSIKVLSRPLFKELSGDIGDAKNCKKIIVSMVVGEFLAEHKDILPNCAVYGTDSSPIGAIRDDNGAIIGVKQLVRYR